MTFSNNDLFNCCTNLAEPDWLTIRALEIGACQDSNEGEADETCIVSCDENEAEFWTVYAREFDETCQAITDCKTRDLARQIMRELETKRKKVNPVYYCQSWGEDIEFANWLGWDSENEELAMVTAAGFDNYEEMPDHHKCDIGDSLEAGAYEFIESKGYKVQHDE